MPQVKMRVWKSCWFEAVVNITDDEALDLETNGDVANPDELLKKYNPQLSLEESGEPEVLEVSDYETDKVIYQR